MEGAAESEPTRIMVAVNKSSINGYPHASRSSKGAFDWTLNKIVRLNTSGFKLLFVHVIEPPEPGLSDDSGMGLLLLYYFVNRCHELQVPCDAWIKKGTPHIVICDEVRRVQPDFLVVGSRGLGFFRRFFLISVSEFCFNHAECPIIIIKRNADEAPGDPADD